MIHQLTIEEISIDVERKKIKSLRIVIYPQTGKVRLAAPWWVSDETVRSYAISKLSWIKEHRNRLIVRKPQPVYEYVSGESHFYNGNPYLLEVIPSLGRPKVELEHATLKLFIRTNNTKHQRSALLAEWYRERMKAQLPALITTWESRMGVEVREWGIKQMRSRWGSCNVRAHRIWLSLALAKKPVRCLEYVLVHEMAHLLVPNHSAQFKALMNTFLPQWKMLRQELKHEG
jgi:predicted metal-dependent hydrolase